MLELVKTEREFIVKMAVTVKSPPLTVNPSSVKFATLMPLPAALTEVVMWRYRQARAGCWRRRRLCRCNRTNWRC